MRRPDLGRLPAIWAVQRICSHPLNAICTTPRHGQYKGLLTVASVERRRDRRVGGCHATFPILEGQEEGEEEEEE